MRATRAAMASGNGERQCAAVAALRQGSVGRLAPLCVSEARGEAEAAHDRSDQHHCSGNLGGGRSDNVSPAVPVVMALLTIVAAGRVRARPSQRSSPSRSTNRHHIAAGMQLLDEDRYTYEALHPPLARVRVALGPYLAHYRTQHGGDTRMRGAAAFTRNPAIPISTSLARAGAPAIIILCLVLVWIWTGRYVRRSRAPSRWWSRQLCHSLAHSRPRHDRRGVCRDLAGAFFAF